MGNKVLDKFNKGELSVGAFTHLRSMAAVEALGITGIDYVIVDMEHSPTGIDEASKYITAADAAGIEPFVRVSGIERKDILHTLDTGAKGIIVPCIEKPEQVKELIGYAKFKPLGNRGYCATRDGLWGNADCYENGMEGYMAIKNKEALIIPQCETVGCLENIDEIVSMDGVDGIMLGPYDLSIGLGIPGQFDHPIFKEAIEKVLKAVKAAKKPVLVFAGNDQVAKERANQGFDSVIVGIDLWVLMNKYKEMVAEIKK